MLPPGVNLINMFMHSFFVRKTKMLLVFENKFHYDSLYKNCSGCANHKSLFAVLLAIRKSQLVVHKNFSKKP